MEKRFVISYNPQNQDVCLMDTGKIEADVNLDLFSAECFDEEGAMFMKFSLENICDYLNYQHEELEEKEKLLKIRERQLQIAMNYLISDMCSLTDGQLKKIESEMLEVQNE